MTVKQEISALRKEIAQNQAALEVVRTDGMWNKIIKLAAEDGDVQLLEDIAWFLPKLKFYTDRHARANSAQDKARRARAVIKDEDYDRLRPLYATDAALADKLGVEPGSLSKYKARRFGKP